jgi:hypothetical protein
VRDIYRNLSNVFALVPHFITKISVSLAFLMVSSACFEAFNQSSTLSTYFDIFGSYLRSPSRMRHEVYFVLTFLSIMFANFLNITMYFLPVILKCIILLIKLVIALWCRKISIVYKVAVLSTSWKWTLVKRELSLLLKNELYLSNIYIYIYVCS